MASTCQLTMAYNTNNLTIKLAAINETQESITSISQWLMFHKRYAAQSAETWSAFTQQAPDNKKLALIYLANEVVQQCRARRKDEFVEAFAKVIPSTLKRAYSSVTPDIQNRMERVVKVWRDRSIFSPDVQAEMESAVSGGSHTGTTPSSALGGHAVPSELVGIVEAFHELNKVKLKLDSQLKEFDTAYSKAFENMSRAPLESFQLMSKLENTTKTVKSLAEDAAAHQTKLASMVEEWLTDLKKPLLPSNFEDECERIVATKSSLLEVLGKGPSDGQSSDVDAPTPEALTPEAAHEVEHPPTVYTAGDAVATHVLNDTNAAEDELGYAESGDEAPEAKKTKLDLDPKLASFLASLASKK